MNEKPIGYRLNESARLFNEVVKKQMTSRGISRTYFQILKYLESHNDEEITQKMICDFLMMKPSTISITLQGMENEGLIKRSKDQNDSRKMIIRLTDVGEQKSKEFKSIFKACDDILLSAISKEEESLLYEILDKLNMKMDGEI